MEYSCKNCASRFSENCNRCLKLIHIPDSKPTCWRPILYGIKNPEIDMVNHPNHYKSESGLEVIDVIKAFTSDLTGYQAVDTGNIIRYICRWNKKNGLEDLKKARWYLDDLIKEIEKGEMKNENRISK